MSRSAQPTRASAVAAALLATLVLTGCEKRTTSVTTPSGTSTTTTVTPSASATATADRATDAAGDAALTAMVKTALLADDSVKGLRIDVDTSNGVVTLNGSADSQANATRAETLAKGVDGVKSVQNRLAIGSAGTTTAVVPNSSTSASAAPDSAGRAVDRAADSTGRALDRAGDATGRAVDKAGDAIGDAAITAKVKTALLADPDVKGLQIDVDTKDGAVSLSGALDKSANVTLAESIAKRVDGVKSVSNRLTVKSGG